MASYAMNFPETLQEAIVYFTDAGRAFEAAKVLRWHDGVARCPHCESVSVAFMAKRMIWNCRQCRKQFSVKVGTVFEDSPLSLTKWMPAVWMIANAKNGISSCEIGRALGVTQKTAWFMLQRIRMAMQDGTPVSIGGTVEVDETFIGGKARMMNAERRAKLKYQGATGPCNMSPVQGLLERGTRERASRVILKHVDVATKNECQGNIEKHVKKGAEVHTDETLLYHAMNPDYAHKVINHAQCYAKGHVHINGLENFWSLLKRTIRGTYVSVEPFHLFRYLDEQAFRFNERKDCDQGRFLKAIVGIIGKRLTYKKLIGQDDAGGLPACA